MATVQLFLIKTHIDYKMNNFYERPVLGVLGGMGPGAAVDFQQRLLDGSPASNDQEHIPTIIWNHGGIPDRQLALKKLGESPLEAMLHGMKILERSGVSKIVIPCNTAHFWYSDLQNNSSVEIFNMVQITIGKILEKYKSGDRIGILATRGALLTELYQHELIKHSIPFVINSDQEISEELMPAVYDVKRNQKEKAGLVFEELSQRLIDKGATSIILACTEIPLGLNAVNSSLLKMSYDTTQILADACLNWYYQKLA